MGAAGQGVGFVERLADAAEQGERLVQRRHLVDRSDISRVLHRVLE
jgi:hypothetical protein